MAAIAAAILPERFIFTDKNQVNKHHNTLVSTLMCGHINLANYGLIDPRTTIYIPIAYLA